MAPQTPPPPPPQRRKACAACTRQRRRCSPDCIFARHFLHDPDTLTNIYDLFGYENARKHLIKVKAEKQEETARSLGNEANWRKLYPVTGSLEVIHAYENLIREAQIELDTIQTSIQQFKMMQSSSPHHVQQDQIENTAWTSKDQNENTENHEISSSTHDAMPPNDGKS